MKQKSSLISYFVIILMIGAVSTIINSDIPFGAIIQNWQSYEIEALLEYVSFGLAFLAFGSIFVYLIVRAARGKEVNWLEQVLRDKQEEDKRDS